jgi:KipI family sensor histidine kinase inhibitor
MHRLHTYWVSETAGVLDLPGEATLERQRRIWWLAHALRERPGVREIVPGMNNLTVVVDPESAQAERLLEEMEAAWHRSGQIDPSSREVRIPVQYGGAAGPDLDAVAAHTGLAPARIVELHAAASYTVFFLGFLPGFAYLGGMDARLATPRRAQPRLEVPAGSVAIGGSQTGVYPLAAPGGWQIIGATALKLFDLQQDPPALLRPGDRVRFVDTGDVA